MSENASFRVYNASAGSGKTFSLVKSYLLTLLSSQKVDGYKNMLAITFTNKAVGEMKTRILKQLVLFGTGNPEGEPMWESILKETGLPKELLKKRSQEALQHLLNHYSLFSVETIDHFNHRLIRTFAKDLQLSSQFEVSLDTPSLLSEAVDQLIEKAGEDPEITEWLLAFALQKTAEDKSWDISHDLNKVAKMLTQENDVFFLEKLQGVPLSKFNLLKNKISQEIPKLETETQQIAKNVLNTLHDHQLDKSHFNGGYLYSFYEKTAEDTISLEKDPSWYVQIDEKNLYPKRVTSTEAQQIDSLIPVFKESYEAIKKNVFQISLLQNIFKNLVPLATVHLIHEELQTIKEDQNVLPINEFNQIIYKELKNQPAAYIYERLGDRYQHFYIDEFQDTSLMQWENLMPLIENSLSQTDGNSLMVVGDAKQAIYRWRGGLPEQFIALFQDRNPFPSVEKEVVNLTSNYRSCQEIVHFNNAFFSHVASFFGNPVYQHLYKVGNQQEAFKSCTGYVSVSLLEASNKEERFEKYPQKTLETVESLLNRGFSKKDICILTRKKEEGIAISELLSKCGISVVSEETLLLKNAPKVKGLVALIHLLVTPENEMVKFDALLFLYEFLKISDNKHDFLEAHIKSPLYDIADRLSKEGIAINFDVFQEYTTLEIFERLIYSLHLNLEEDAYLTHFMELVFQFSKGPQNSPTDFLEYWELQKDRVSLSFSHSLDAISVMTVHKSKGLEFPVVIFPFADVELYQEQDAKAWFPWNDNGFEDLLINFNKDVAQYGSIGASLYENRRNTLELDNINILYVALTRAEQELYIIGKKEKEKADPKNYSDLLLSFLNHKGLSNEDNHYEWGSKVIPSTENLSATEETSFQYISTLPNENAIKFAHAWQAGQTRAVQDSIDFGNYFHQLMEQLQYLDQVEYVLEEFSSKFQPSQASLWKALSNTVQKTIAHPLLAPLFQRKDTVYCEREIISSNEIIRPDRINIHEDHSFTLVDYKTGSEKPEDSLQINHYAVILKQMGYRVREKYLVYVNDDDIVVNYA